MDHTLKSEANRTKFEAYLKKEFSSENLEFQKDCAGLAALPRAERAERARELVEKYIVQGAADQINIPAGTREKIESAVKAKNDIALLKALGQAQVDINTLVRRDSYPRFLKETYKGDQRPEASPDIAVWPAKLHEAIPMILARDRLQEERAAQAGRRAQVAGG
nr:regulator of G-protein signaling domain-containing protein [Ramlibacter albus]